MGRSKSRSRKDIVCYNCGEKGHYKNQCKQPKKNKKKGKEVESTESKDNTTATVQGGDYLILSPSDDIFSCVCQDLEWVIDTGASYCATPWREFLPIGLKILVLSRWATMAQQTSLAWVISI